MAVWCSNQSTVIAILELQLTAFPFHAVNKVTEVHTVGCLNSTCSEIDLLALSSVFSFCGDLFLF